MIHVVSKERIHSCTVQPLGLGDRAILVCEEQSLEIDNFFTELRDRGGEGIVLCAKKLDLRLQVGQPLLFSLTAFERSDPAVKLAGEIP